MSAFNRVFVVVSLGIVLVAGAAFLLAPDFVIGIVRSLADVLNAALFAGLSEVGQFAVRALLALAWVALFALFIWLEVRRVGTPTVEVARYTGGNTIRVSTAAVADRIRENVMAVEGVLEAHVSAIGRDRAIEVKVDVAAERSVDLIAKAEEIAALVRRVIQDELGLKLATKPQISIQPRDGRAGAPRLLRPLAPFSPRPAPEVPLSASNVLKPPAPEAVLPLPTAEVELPAREPAQPTVKQLEPSAGEELHSASTVLESTEDTEQPNVPTAELVAQPPARPEPTQEEGGHPTSVETDDRDTTEARRHP